MTRPDPSQALALLRTGHTVFLAKKPYLAQPVLTTELPCGQTKAFRLGRAFDGVMPTPAEVADDLVAGLQQLGRELRRAA